MARPLRTTVLLRSLVGLVLGVVVAIFVVPSLGVAAGLLAGWATLALTGVVWVVIVLWPMDAAATRAHATGEDPGRQLARLVAVFGSVASLGAVAVVLVQTRHASNLESFAYAAIAVASVATSWALIQIDYMLRIAHEYYREPVGGIAFNQSEEPMYTDFIYVSVGLGMTYQIADTSLTNNKMRRIVIGQTLLAYLFGAVILATVINLVTNLG